MLDKVEFTLVSPERLVLREKVDMVVMPGEQGDFGVLPFHAALVSNLRAGLIFVHNNEIITHQIFISGGFANVNERGCTVLAEECVFLDDLKKQNLMAQLNDIQIDLELARTDEEQRDLQKNMQITRTKIDLIQRLLHQ